MNRRIVRAVLQLGVVITIVTVFIVIIDSRVRVLPASIHDHLPSHHAGLVITDLTVVTCSSLNLLSSCRLDRKVWHRIEKDLYLGLGWSSKAYLHVQRKPAEGLLATDKVIIDLKMGRLDPGAGTDHKWESRPGGIWLKRTHYDSTRSVTAVDALFGPDAVDPRRGWEIKDTPLYLDLKSDARLTIRRGESGKIERPIPKIRKDGKFKIMQVSDLHLSTGVGVCRHPFPVMKDESKCEADPRTLEFIDRLLENEKPDLVVLSGDQVNGDTSPDTQTTIYKYADVFIRHKIPFAAIFGNHDGEGSLGRKESMAILESLPYSLAEAGPEEVDGVGNYLVEVLGRGGSKSALTLYLLDSHNYSFDEKKYPGYAWLKESQVEWFRSTSHSLLKSHNQYTHIHMNLAFIHIALPEYRKTSNYYVGKWLEPPTAPRYNSGFRDALVDENVAIVSCGHDHANDYCMLEKDANDKPALWMCYAGGSGFGGYGGYNGYIRRVRFFDIDMNEARIMSYKRLEWGDTEAKIDEMMLVDGGRVISP